MLMVTPLTPSASEYFARGPETGRWSGGGCAQLALSGEITGVALRRVLDGRDPCSGRSLLDRRPAHRRAGWDLTFAAPKSLSLLAALAGEIDAALLADAHRGAVDDSIGWMARHACQIRRAGRREPGAVVVARYDHHASDSGDPHLHSHALLANAALGADGRWSPLASPPLWPALRPLGGMYRLALRARLAGAGLHFAWRAPGAGSPSRDARHLLGAAAAGDPGPAPEGQAGAARADGLVEVAGVAAAAVAAVSSRSQVVSGALEGWDDREMAGRAARRAVRGVTRRQRALGEGRSAIPVERAPDRGWEQRVAAAGLDRAAAAVVLAGARSPGPDDVQPTGPPEAAVTAWLASLGSTFTTLDVVRAVVATSQAGMAPAAVDRWVGRYCGDGDPYDGRRRWSTAEAEAADRALLDAAAATRSNVAVPTATLDAVIAAHRLGAPAAAEVRRLVGSGGGVDVFRGHAGRSAFVEQAVVLAAAANAWKAAGHRVGLLAPALSARRWDALTALRAGPGQVGSSGTVAGLAGPGRAGPGEAAPGHPAVVIVDRADRIVSDRLHQLLHEAGRSGGKLVLVDGGTLPARHHPASAALAHLGGDGGDRGPRRWNTYGAPLGAPSDRSAALDPATQLPDPVLVEDRVTAVGVAPGDAIGDVVAQWASRPPGRRPLLVGLGPAEVEALNRAARNTRVARGELAGPVVTAGGRPYQVGDSVVALRMLRVPAGSAGTVVALDPASGQMTVAWPDRTTVVDRHDARRLGHGYASTPGRVPAGASALLLGDPRQLNHLSGRRVTVVGAALVAPASQPQRPDQLDLLAADAARRRPPGDRNGIVPAPVRVPLGQLHARRQRLADRLYPMMPSGRASPGATGAPALPAVGMEASAVRAWADDHHADLVEWDQLSRAVALHPGASERAAAAALHPGAHGPRPGGDTPDSASPAPPGPDTGRREAGPSIGWGLR